MSGVAAISASGSIKDLTKPEAVGRRSADKEFIKEESEGDGYTRVCGQRCGEGCKGFRSGLAVGDWRVTRVGVDKI